MPKTSSETTENSSINQELSIIAKGAGFSFFGRVFGKGLKFVIIALITRTLGVSLYGIYTLGLAIVNFSSRISSFGLNLGGLRFIAALRGKKKQDRVKGVVWENLLIPLFASIFFASLIYFFSPYITSFLHEPGLRRPLKALVFAIPFSTLLFNLGFISRGFKKIECEVFGRSIIQPLSQLVLITGIYFVGYHLYGIIFAYIFSLIIAIVGIFVLLKRRFPTLTQSTVKPEFQPKKILKVSFPLMYVGLVSFFHSWVDIFMISYFLSAAKVGIYKIAVTVSGTLPIVYSGFSSIFSPVISEYYHSGKIKKLGKIFKIVSKWVLYLTIPILLVVLLSPKEILLIFGEEFQVGVPPLLILSLGRFFNVIFFSVGIMLGMTEYQNQSALIVTIGTILNIALNFLFLGMLNLSITGAAIATAVSTSLISLSGFLIILRKIKISPLSSKTLVGLISAGTSLSLGYICKQLFFSSYNHLLSFILTSGLSISIFASLIFLFGLEPSDRFIFEKIKNKFYSSF